MKRYILVGAQILSTFCIMYHVVYLAIPTFPQSASTEIAPLVPAPNCPLNISVSCPSAWCLKTLKSCSPTGPIQNGVCCLDIDDFGCCSYTSKNVQKCTCIDENGVQHDCVDQYGIPYYSADCTRVQDWVIPDPTFRCCTEGSKKGQCEYITYLCN